MNNFNNCIFQINSNLIKKDIFFSIFFIQFSIFILNPICLIAQETDKWDNQLYYGNKVSWGKNKIKYSGEFQIRLEDDFTKLEQWFLEGVISYMPAKNWEITPDLRYSIKTNKRELRPGLGVLYKHTIKKSQLVHQLKWQIDIDNYSNANHGLRYVLFYNHVFNEKLIGSAIGGGFYRWSEVFTGIRFLRFGGGITWVVDVKHSINFNYFLGMTQELQNEWTYLGIPMIQLIFNINKDYKYLPAKYYSF